MTFTNSVVPQTMIITSTTTIGNATIQAIVVGGTDQVHFINGPLLTIMILKRSGFSMNFISPINSTGLLFVNQTLILTLAPIEVPIGSGVTIDSIISASDILVAMLFFTIFIDIH